MDMKNTGVEFEISADLVKTPNVLWNVSVNGTHYRNEITKLPSDQPQDGYNNGIYWRELEAPCMTSISRNGPESIRRPASDCIMSTARAERAVNW